MKKQKKKFNAWRLIKRPLIVFIIVWMLWLLYIWAFLPDVRELKKFNPQKTAFMEYRLQLLKKKHRSLKKKYHWVSIKNISPFLIYAVLIAEDDKFYMHAGFDWDSIKESIKENIRKKRMVSGGSTITQQLAKNLYLNPRKSIFRKINEALITIKLEKELSKKRILEIYLNIIEWGKGIFGAEAAALYYYNKHADELSIDESIRLASILPNPIRFSPLSNTSRRIIKKRETICQRLYKKGYISEQEYREILKKIK